MHGGVKVYHGVRPVPGGIWRPTVRSGRRPRSCGQPLPFRGYTFTLPCIYPTISNNSQAPNNAILVYRDRVLPLPTCSIRAILGREVFVGCLWFVVSGGSGD
jgi:hypothetical protein